MNKNYLTGALALSLVCNAVLFYKLTHVTPPLNSVSDTTQTVASSTESHVSGASYPFIRVVDGDTIVVGVDGKSEYVRLIGIDSPEPNDPGGPECYANEATEHLKGLAHTGTVVLHFDASQGYRDTYGRLLAYVELPDGTDLGERMLRDGYAHEYTYDKPYERTPSYKTVATEAMTQKAGLWADGVCAR